MKYNVTYLWSTEDDNESPVRCDAPELIEADSEEEAIEALKDWIVEMTDKDDYSITVEKDSLMMESKYIDLPSQRYYWFEAEEFEED